jgi:diketogulonate reductase-like aldo/keto reductase
MAPATTPALKLNNSVTTPALGLGVFQSPPEQTVAAVETALHVGYRLIDTAAACDNEREVGAGIRRSGVDRDEIFVTTKLWIRLRLRRSADRLRRQPPTAGARPRRPVPASSTGADPL